MKALLGNLCQLVHHVMNHYTNKYGNAVIYARNFTMSRTITRAYTYGIAVIMLSPSPCHEPLHAQTNMEAVASSPIFIHIFCEWSITRNFDLCGARSGSPQLKESTINSYRFVLSMLLLRNTILHEIFIVHQNLDKRYTQFFVMFNFL